MKKILSFIALPALLAASMQINASGKITILDDVYQVDTVSHLKAGPGTTTTHLKLTGPNLLQVHYLTLDKTAPGVSIHAVCGTDKVAGCERTTAMAKRKTDDKRLYFAGTNADFFVTAGNATNGTSKVGTPIGVCIVDGEPYTSTNVNCQFTVDRDGVAHVGYLNFFNGTATLGDKVTLFKGINVDSPDNGITLYTSRFWGSSNQNIKAGNCAEVVAKLVEGDEFLSGGTYRMEILSEPNATGDTPVPDGQFVIHGRGTAVEGGNTGALEFVNSLKPGDVVTLDNVVMADGQRIYPMQVVSGNVKSVGNGVNLGPFGDMALHPRTGIGVSQDGNKIIMMVVEGRYGGSAGVRMPQLSDILRYAGAYEGSNLDGGGSSTLYTHAFGIRNFCSDGSERAVSNGIFATVDLPEQIDNTITEIRFADWSMNVPKFARYTPKLLGYNSLGLLVDENITDYTLSCPSELGQITDGKTLFATGGGTHALTAEVNGVKTSIPVTVDNNVEFTTRLPQILLDSREYTIELIATDGIKTTNVAPEALSWSSSDAAVATVTDEGVIKGISNGQATITGVVGEKQVEIAVTVEIADKPFMNIIEGLQTADWKFAKSGCSSATTFTASEAGLDIDYTISSSRSASLTLTPLKQIPVWSIPGSLEFHVTPTSASIKDATIKFVAANGEQFRISLPEILADKETVANVKMSELIDAADLVYYPVKLLSIAMTLQPKNGLKGKISIPAFNAVYAAEDGVDEIIDDTLADGSESVEYYNLQGVKVTNPERGLFIKKSGGKAQKVIKR